MSDRGDWYRRLAAGADDAGVVGAAIDHLTETNAFDAIYVCGLALARQGKQEGLVWCAAALTLTKAPDDWFANCVIAARNLQRLDLAVQFATRGLTDYPDHEKLTYQRGLTFCELHDWPSAIADMSRALELKPGSIAGIGLGYCYHLTGRHTEAMALYDSLLTTLSGRDKESVVNNMICMLVEAGRPHDVLALCEKHCPDTTWTRTIYNRSYVLLGSGMWPEGWRDYQTRSHADGVSVQSVPDEWRPKCLDDLHGESVTLLHEQGLGDSIMFLRYLLKLEPLVDRLTIAVPTPLVRWARLLRLDRPCEVVEVGREKDLVVKTRYVFPVMDLPHLFSQTVRDIPGGTYLHPIPVEAIKSRPIPLRPDRLAVGICWAGDSRLNDMRANYIDRRRSMPFGQLDGLLSIEANWVSLQMPNHRVDDDRLIQPLEDGFDLLDTAAVIAQLDLVISVDTAVAHLAAAHGKPTWLLSRFDGCWRWFFDGRATSPWYPSMRIFRQPRPGDWSSVIDEVIHYLTVVPPSEIGANHLLEMQRLAGSCPRGCFVEVGVYRGGSAWHLAQIADQQGRRLHLFDTFTGIPHKGPVDLHEVGDFGDVDLDAIKRAIPSAEFLVGIFPDTLPDRLRDIAFVHCDVDQCDAVREVIEKLWPRMVPGGIMMFDDWDQDGARELIRDTFGERLFNSNGRYFARK